MPQQAPSRRQPSPRRSRRLPRPRRRRTHLLALPNLRRRGVRAAPQNSLHSTKRSRNSAHRVARTRPVILLGWRADWYSSGFLEVTLAARVVGGFGHPLCRCGFGEQSFGLLVGGRRLSLPQFETATVWVREIPIRRGLSMLQRILAGLLKVPGLLFGGNGAHRGVAGT